MKRNILLDYSGIIHYETIGELIHQLKHQIYAFGVEIGTYKRILLVMIESLENMMKYSLHCADIHGNDQVYASSLSIIKEDTHYRVISSNVIRTTDIPALKNRIECLNSLDQEGIRKLYRQTITNGVFTSTGGAGLGLIEIARISGKAIQYNFAPVDEMTARYTQQIIIDEYIG